MTKITAGTVSAGTMQPCDLIPAFMDALIDNGAADVAERLTADYQRGYDWASDSGRLRVDDETLDRIQEKHPDAASELITELFDELNELAPPFHYFGAIDGDGADYGFWVQVDQIRESIEGATRLVSSEYLVNLEDEVFWHVNDHGNVTGWALAGIVDTTPFVEVV